MRWTSSSPRSRPRSTRWPRAGDHQLSFDEWNVWYHSHSQDREIEDWALAPPRLEDAYTMEDALVVGGMLISLLNHCDRVRIGCLAQAVNVIAPILTVTGGPAWRQSIFHPFAQASAMARGMVLKSLVQSPLYDAGDRQGIPVLKSACVWHPERRELVVLAVNRSLDTPVALELDLRAFPAFARATHTVLQHPDLKAVNTVTAPNTVQPRLGLPCTVDSTPAFELAPASWNVIQLQG
jgi:alpha-N-arabinofuranosidase